MLKRTLIDALPLPEQRYREAKRFLKKNKHHGHLLDYTGDSFGLISLSKDGDLIRHAAGHTVIVARRKVAGEIDAYLREMTSGKYSEDKTLTKAALMTEKLGKEAFWKWYETDALARAVEAGHETQR
jgi:hypothetical protein